MKLEQVLTQKRAELDLFRHDLTTVEFRGDPWRTKSIAILEGHVKEIERYAKDGGKLNIGKCCQKEGTCFITFKRFDVCALKPGECGFYFNEVKI